MGFRTLQVFILNIVLHNIKPGVYLVSSLVDFVFLCVRR